MRLRVMALGMLAGAAALAGQPRPDFGGRVVSAAERFDLYTGCAPVEVAVELYKTNPVRPVELTRAAIGATGYERLEAAGLLATDTPHKLNLGVSVIGDTLTFWARFFKQLDDPLTKQTRASPTWMRFTAGPHLGRTQAVLDTLGQHVDNFITSYQRVNGEACGEG